MLQIRNSSTAEGTAQHGGCPVRRDGCTLAFGEESVMSNLREITDGNALFEARVVFNPLTAKLASAQ